MMEFTQYYNTHCSHTERDHLPRLVAVPEEVLTVDRDEVAVRSYIVGLVRSFERKAAYLCAKSLINGRNHGH